MNRLPLTFCTTSKYLSSAPLMLLLGMGIRYPASIVARILSRGMSGMSEQEAVVTVQIFFCDPVVLESICFRTRANRLINESNTTGGMGKNGRFTRTRRVQKAGSPRRWPGESRRPFHHAMNAFSIDKDG